MIAKEEREVWKDGRITWASSTKLPMRDAAGKIIGVMGISRDITERRQSEQRIADALNFTETLLYATPVGILVYKVSGQCVSANEAAVKITGGTKEQLLQQDFRKIESWKRNGMLDAAEAALADSSEREFETHFANTFGREMWIHCRFMPFRYQDEQHLLVTVVDIAARKRAEEALLESQALHHSLVEQMPAAVFRKDKEGRFVLVNSQFCHRRGLTQEEVLGRTPEELIPVAQAKSGATPPELIPLLAEGMKHHEQIMRSGEQIEMEEEWTAGDGRKRYFSVVKSPVFGSDGKIIGTQGVQFDITERKQAEQALHASEAKFRMLADSTASAIFIYRGDHYCYTNPAFQAMTGYNEAELQEINFWDVAHPDFREQVRNRGMARQRGEHPPMRYEIKILTKSMGERWLDFCDGRIEFEGRPAVLGTAFDITERKQAEEGVRMLSRAVEQSPASIIITDKAGGIEYVNPKFCEVTGYTAEEAIGKNPRILKSGETPPEGYKKIWETISSGKEWRGEFHNKKKNGELYWEYAAICPIFNAAGQIVRYLAVKEDMTARKQAEEELQRVNRALRTTGDCNLALVRSTTESALLNDICRIIVEDGGHRLAWVSIAEDDEHKSVRCAAHAGRGEGYIEKLNVTWGDDERGRGPVGTAIRTGQVVSSRDALADPIFAPWRDEAIKHGLASLIVFPLLAGGKAFGALAIYSVKTDSFNDQEVTLLSELASNLGYGIQTLRARDGRRRAEERIHEQALMLELAPDAIIVRDLERRIVYWNKGAELLYGWKARQAIGQDAAQILHADQFQFEKARQSVLEHGDWRGEFTTHTKDGGEVLVEARWTLLKDDRGVPKTILTISTDITGRKKLEDQFYRAQRMESLGTLASGIAHDLNNVLQPIMVSVELLKTKVADDDGRKMLNSLDSCVHRGAALVKQVLVFGRGIKGERFPLQLRQVVLEIEHIIHETFPKSVELEVQCPGNLWPVNGDSNQINQVLLNLCVNARDAMPDGGKLSIQLANAVLDQIAAAENPDASPGSFVVIKVADTGTGIPKTVQAKIFEPFYTTKSVGKGTGLGLSTSMAIVKGHGGFINCYSEEGKGSVFKVYLPADARAAGAKTADTKQKARLPRGQNELVLLVDDEDGIREIVQKILERFGYRVVAAVNGAEAVSIYKARQTEIAVVITDMAMPVMDGPAAIVEMKSINPEVKIIASSGMASEGGLARAIGAGVAHFLTKPYTAEAVLEKLQEVLHGG